MGGQKVFELGVGFDVGGGEGAVGDDLESVDAGVVEDELDEVFADVLSATTVGYPGMHDDHGCFFPAVFDIGQVAIG